MATSTLDHFHLGRHSAAVEALAICGTRLCSAGLDGSINCWDVASDEGLAGTVKMPSGVLSLLSLGDDWLLAGLCNGSLRACRTRPDIHAVTTSASRHAAPVRALAVCAARAGLVVVSGSDDASLRLWTVDLSSDSKEAKAQLHCTCRLLVPTSTVVTSVTFGYTTSSRVLLASSCSHASSEAVVSMWYLNEGCTAAIAKGTLCEAPFWLDTIMFSRLHQQNVASTAGSSATPYLTLYCGWWNGGLQRRQLDFLGALQCSNVLLLSLDMENAILCMDEVSIPSSMHDVHTKNVGRPTLLVCGLSNGTIKAVVVGENGKWSHTLPIDLYGHEDAVSDLKIFDDKLFSASWDGTLRIWPMVNIWDEVKAAVLNRQ